MAKKPNALAQNSADGIGQRVLRLRFCIFQVEQRVVRDTEIVTPKISNSSHKGKSDAGAENKTKIIPTSSQFFVCLPDGLVHHVRPPVAIAIQPGDIEVRKNCIRLVFRPVGGEQQKGRRHEPEDH